MRRYIALLPWFLAGALAAQSFEEDLRTGLVALSHNDLTQARQHLESASRQRPGDAMVWAALAETYLRAKDPAQADAAASRATLLAPADSPAQHALAMFYFETGDFERAAAAERKYAGSRSADTQAAISAAELSLRAGELEQAVTWSENALKRSDTAQTHHLLGQAYTAANRPADAERELRIAVARDPSMESYVSDLSQMQLRSSDFAGAMATAEEGCRRFPNSAQLRLIYGVAAYGQRRFADATDAFLRVISIDPSVDQPYLFLSRILGQAGDRLPRVVAAFAKRAESEPGNYLAHCFYAKALSAASAGPAQIEAELRRSIRLNDHYWESHYELGVLLGKGGQWKEAAAELSRSIALNPEVAAAHFQLARAYEKLGDSEKANAERAEHERLTAAETGVGDLLPGFKDRR